MAKYAGKIGFVLFDSSVPGVVKEVDSPSFIVEIFLRILGDSRVPIRLMTM